MDISKITKEEFDLAYNKFSANLWIRLVFKYFSTKTEKNNMKPSQYFVWLLLILFVVGFLGTILNLDSKIIAAVTLTYTGLLFLLGILMGGAAILNNLRIRKIRKILGVTKWEYEFLVGKFYPSESDIKYILK